MQAIKSKTFDAQLDTIIDFIASDSIDNALKFINDLEKNISALPHMPYKFRQSIYFNDPNIRDYIFKGYVIPYLIDVNEKQIVLLGIVKYRETL